MTVVHTPGSAKPERPGPAQRRTSVDLQRPTGVSNWEATTLVAGREISTRLRDRAFIFSAIFLLLVVLAAIVLPVVFQGGKTTVAVVADSGWTAANVPGTEVQQVADAAAAEALVRSGDVDAALVTDPSAPLGVKIVALEEAPSELVAQLSVASPVQLLEPPDLSPALAFLIPFALAMVFFMTSLTFGLSIAQSVVQEKETRVVEILVAAIPVRALLAGKVLGATALAFGQILLVVIVAMVGLTAVGSDLLSGEVLGQLMVAIGWFVPFFLIGFLMLAGLWAVSGALVTRLEDLGSASLPMQMLVMVPAFAVMYGSGNASLLAVLSYVPFSAPIAMPVRVFKGEVIAAWEPLLSLGLVALTGYWLVRLAAALYSASVLRTNRKNSFVRAWRAARADG